MALPSSGTDAGCSLFSPSPLHMCIRAACLQLLPRVKEIGGDANQLVRSALATVVMELAPILGKVRLDCLHKPCVHSGWYWQSARGVGHSLTAWGSTSSTYEGMV